MKKDQKFDQLIIIQLLSVFLISCSGGGNNGANPRVTGQDRILSLSTPLQENLANTLTISDIKAVPQLENSPLNAFIYVYNNSTKPLDHISYRIKNANPFLAFNLDPSSINRCSQILAGDKCKFYFTGSLAKNINQGQVILEANYSVGKNTKPAKSFSRTVNVVRVGKTAGSKSNQSLIDPNLIINSYGNSTGHGLIYVFNASGKIVTDKPGVEVSEAHADGLRAIELATPSMSGSYKVNLLLNTNNSNTKLTPNPYSKDAHATDKYYSISKQQQAINSNIFVAGKTLEGSNTSQSSKLQDTAASGALISIRELSGNDHKLSITGNGIDARTSSLLISNNSTKAANLIHSIQDIDNNNNNTYGSNTSNSVNNSRTNGNSQQKLNNRTKRYLSIDSSSTCGTILAAGASCEVKLKLNPTKSQTKINGTAVYKLIYSGGDTQNNQIDYEINYNISSANFSITMINAKELTVNGEVLYPKMGATYYFWNRGQGTKQRPNITLGDGNGIFNPNEPKQHYVRFIYKNTGENIPNMKVELNDYTKNAYQLSTVNEHNGIPNCLNVTSFAKDALCFIEYVDIIGKIQKNTPWLDYSGWQELMVKVPTFIKLNHNNEPEEEITPLMNRSNEDSPDTVRIVAHYDVVDPRLLYRFNKNQTELELSNSYIRGLIIKSGDSPNNPYAGSEITYEISDIYLADNIIINGSGCEVLSEINKSEIDNRLKKIKCTIPEKIQTNPLIIKNKSLFFKNFITFDISNININLKNNKQYVAIRPANGIGEHLKTKDSDGISYTGIGNKVVINNIKLDNNDNPQLENLIRRSIIFPESFGSINAIGITKGGSYVLLGTTVGLFNCTARLEVSTCYKEELNGHIGVKTVSKAYLLDDKQTSKFLMIGDDQLLRIVKVNEKTGKVDINNKFKVPTYDAASLNSLEYPFNNFGVPDIDKFSYIGRKPGRLFETNLVICTISTETCYVDERFNAQNPQSLTSTTSGFYFTQVHNQINSMDGNSSNEITIVTKMSHNGGFESLDLIKYGIKWLSSIKSTIFGFNEHLFLTGIRREGNTEKLVVVLGKGGSNNGPNITPIDDKDNDENNNSAVEIFDWKSLYGDTLKINLGDTEIYKKKEDKLKINITDILVPDDYVMHNVFGIRAYCLQRLREEAQKIVMDKFYPKIFERWKEECNGEETCTIDYTKIEIEHLKNLLRMNLPEFELVVFNFIDSVDNEFTEVTGQDKEFFIALYQDFAQSGVHYQCLDNENNVVNEKDEIDLIKKPIKLTCIR